MSVVWVRAPLAWLAPGRLVDEALVAIEDGRIAFAGPSSDLAVLASGPSGPETLAGEPAPPEPDEEVLFDGFVMPGVVDRHVHLGLSDPAAVVRGGVIAVRDLGWPPEDVFPLVSASEGPSFDGPLVRAVGPIVTCRGGYPSRASWAPAGTALEVDGPDQAAAAVRSVLARSGIPVVKIALNADAGPTLSDEELLAVCDAAHAAQAGVTAHVQGRGLAERAIGAGVDEFAHAPWSERLPDPLLEAAARRMGMVSTLDIHSYGGDTPELRTALDNVRRFAAAGGRVTYGTDLGNGPIPAGIHAREAAHLAAAGLAAEQVLEALTFRPLAAGEPGDLVGLGGSPFEDLAALDDVRLVLRAGRRFR